MILSFCKVLRLIPDPVREAAPVSPAPSEPGLPAGYLRKRFWHSTQFGFSFTIIVYQSAGPS
jgi:hypothetical protein